MSLAGIVFSDISIFFMLCIPLLLLFIRRKKKMTEAPIKTQFAE
jgi:hypothetical protein